MNERIQELARQARKNSARWGVYMEEEFYEKFAELIVRECAGVDLYWLGDQDRKSIAEKIKQHFGVE